MREWQILQDLRGAPSCRRKISMHSRTARPARNTFPQAPKVYGFVGKAVPRQSLNVLGAPPPPPVMHLPDPVEGKSGPGPLAGI